MEFTEICNLISEGKELPPHQNIETRIAYQYVKNADTCYKACMIMKPDAAKMKLDAYHMFIDIKREKTKYLESNRRIQSLIMKGEESLSALMKDIEPEADYKELFLRAIEVIEILHGCEGHTMRRSAELSMKGENDVRLLQLR